MHSRKVATNVHTHLRRPRTNFVLNGRRKSKIPRPRPSTSNHIPTVLPTSVLRTTGQSHSPVTLQVIWAEERPRSMTVAAWQLVRGVVTLVRSICWQPPLKREPLSANAPDNGGRRGITRDHHDYHRTSDGRRRLRRAGYPSMTWPEGSISKIAELQMPQTAGSAMDAAKRHHLYTMKASKAANTASVRTPAGGSAGKIDAASEPAASHTRTANSRRTLPSKPSPKRWYPKKTPSASKKRSPKQNLLAQTADVLDELSED